MPHPQTRDSAAHAAPARRSPAPPLPLPGPPAPPPPTHRHVHHLAGDVGVKGHLLVAARVDVGVCSEREAGGGVAAAARRIAGALELHRAPWQARTPPTAPAISNSSGCSAEAGVKPDMFAVATIGAARGA